MKAALFLSLLLLPATAGSGPFLDLHFKQALAEAKQSNRVVFIDFYTTWCGTCKKLDKTTWKNEAVGKWLGKQTVALKIDAEKHMDLAKRYGITGYPSLVFIKANGTLLDKIVGYRSPAEFLSDAKSILSGTDALTRAEEELKNATDKGRAYVAYARKLSNMQRYDRAFAAYQQALQEGARPAGVYRGIYRLHQEVPSALAFLKERQQAKRSAVLAGSASEDVVREFCTLNSSMRRDEETLLIYDTLAQINAQDPTLEHFSTFITRPLMRAKRYADLEAINPVNQRMKKALAQYEETIAGNKDNHKREGASRYLVYILSSCYEVLLGLGRDEEAARVADKVLAIDHGDNGYNMLAWGAYMSGRVNDQHLNWARMAHELAKGEDSAVIDTLARILASSGQRAEAVQLLETSLTKFESKRDKADLKNCLEEIKKQGDEVEEKG